MMFAPGRHRPSALRDCSGTVAIEMTFVLPVLAMMLMGIMEWGRYMYTYNTLQFGCEQAARWGVFHITGTQTAIENYARAQMPGLTPDTLTATIDAAANTVTLDATVEFDFVTSFVSPFPSMTIVARSKM